MEARKKDEDDIQVRYFSHFSHTPLMFSLSFLTLLSFFGQLEAEMYDTIRKRIAEGGDDVGQDDKQELLEERSVPFAICGCLGCLRQPSGA